MVNEWEIDEKKDVALKFTFAHDDDDTYFKERWEDVDDRRDDEKEPVDDWTDLANITSPEIGEVRYLKTHNMYVEYALIQEPLPDQQTGGQFTQDTLGWKHLAIGFQNGYMNFGKEDQENIETKFSTLYGDQTVFTNQRGNINSMKFAYQNFSPRLLFYLGNNKAKFETDTTSFDWEKQETGLLKTRFAKWNKFWSTRQPVKGKANLPLNIIDYSLRNITKKFRSNQGEFIIESMETEFSINDIGKTTFNGFKIGYTPNLFPVESKWNLNDMVWDDSLIDFSNYHLIINDFNN